MKTMASVGRIMESSDHSSRDNEVIMKSRLFSHDPVFVAHIPKTAGTSLRLAAIDYYGDDRVLKNYGAASSETSSIVNDVLLKNRNLSRFKNYMHRSKTACYIGHVSFRSASSAFCCTNLVSFVRDPIAQVVSHYNHFKRWHNYKGGVEEFVTSPSFRNLQSKMVSSLPLPLVGLVGLTDRFDEVLELYNNLYDVELRPVFANVNEDREITHIDNKLSSLICDNNINDVELYNRSVDLFEQRYSLFRMGYDWVYGGITKFDTCRRILTGLAYRAFSDDVVDVVLSVSGVDVATCSSDRFRPDYARYNVPNCNEIGFIFDIPDGIAFDDIVIRVSDSGQVLTDIT